MCCYSLLYNAHTMLPAGHRPATSWVHYTTSCNTPASAPEDGQTNSPKHVELIGIINKLLLLHPVGCLYYVFIPTPCRHFNFDDFMHRVVNNVFINIWAV